jgi:hypothetical protein
LLRLFHAVGVEGRLNIGRRVFCFFRRPADALFHCRQHLLGVVEIARPNSCRVGVGVFQNIGGIAFSHINRLLGRLLRAFVAPFNGDFLRG